MSYQEDLVPQKLMKRLKPEENGRLEVTWRIYDALCSIPQGDLCETQQQFICNERKAAYERWKLEGELMAAKRQHLKSLKMKGKYEVKSVVSK